MPDREIHLHYRYGHEPQSGDAMEHPLTGLLQAVGEGGSIRHAAAQLGLSYRHVWGLLHQWEVDLGAPLVRWTRGQPARLTPQAERLLRAERETRERLRGPIEAVRSGLQEAVDAALDPAAAPGRSVPAAGGPVAPADLDDASLLRHSRHILLDGIGIEGVRRVLRSHALVIGAGGLGSPVAMYLGAAGVGRLTLVDPDTVELTNLQRQIAHAMPRLGQPKVDSAAIAVAALNPAVRVDTLARRADAALLDDWVPRCDVVVDCTDNYRTRHAVNAACVRHGRPLVSGAALGFDGQLAVFDPRGDHPCYACLFDPGEPFEEAACAQMGVFAPLVGVIGSLQAAEALKLLAGVPETGTPGRVLMHDARRGTWDTVQARRRPGCPVCGSGAAVTA